MTKHEQLMYFLKAGARAAKLSETVEVLEEYGGTWNGQEQPSLLWSGVLLTPAEIDHEVHSILGKKTIQLPGWSLSYEKYFAGSQWEPPDVDYVEFSQAPSEQAAALEAIMSVLREGVSNAISDAAESLYAEEWKQGEAQNAER